MHPPARVPRPCRARRGFTLVELLVVIGIIAVLAGLLLTVRSRATDKAAQVQCLNNLRQIGMALTMYAQDNSGAFPFSSPLLSSPSDPHPKEDWVHWRGSNLTTVINNSAIAPFVKAKGEAFQTMMRCPADEWDNHSYPYPYSYALNYMLSSDAYVNAAPPLPGSTARPPTPRLSSIQRPSEKCLVGEENERTINDGLWAPGNYTDPSRAAWIVQWDYLSVRHDTRKAEFSTPTVGVLPQQDKRGNVLFVDGHVDYVSRKFAHDPKNLLPNNEGTGRVPNPPPGG